MPTTYEQAGFDVTDVAAGVMKKYHGELVDAGVTVAYLLASSDKGAAVKLNGYPCAAVVKVIGLKERADGRADVEVVIDAAYAAAEAAIPSPANYGVTVDQLERSRGAVRPNGNVSANLQAQWNSSVGTPVRLAGHDGPYVSVMARMSTGSVTYVMHPLTAADPSRPAESWGKRRSSKQWTSSAPADVPLAGVACSSHNGLNYVFADWPTVEVVATREEYVEFEVRRQATADIAAHNRANKKAVPA